MFVMPFQIDKAINSGMVALSSDYVFDQSLYNPEKQISDIPSKIDVYMGSNPTTTTMFGADHDNYQD